MSGKSEDPVMHPATAAAVRVTESVVLNFKQSQIMLEALGFLLWLLVADDASSKERCASGR